ncbi:MAG: SDR family oxidoreductase [Erysipelotrichaceae bacterium]|nr:SDR family oxidoreductase [Erysipelotrichaceae bacterium]
MKEFNHKVVLITGSHHGIGLKTKEMFLEEGAIVCGIDVSPGEYFQGDVSDQQVLEAFVNKVITDYGHIDIIVNNATPIMKGIDDCSYETFMQALAIGVGAPFYLVKLSLPYLGTGASIINISSSRDRMSQSQTESYSAAKGGIAALTHAMANSLRGKARVNSVSPGWIDTHGRTYSGPDATQQLVGRVGEPADIANMILYLASDKASFITGENICIDGGMTKQMIYHDDQGWEYHG